MVRRFAPRRAHPHLASTALLAALAVVVTTDCAEARKHNKQQTPSEVLQNTISGPPIMAVVSIKDQRVSLYDANGGALRSRVSSGRVGYETPVGIYSVLEKEQEHYSNVYDDASMPFMQRITWSGVALHAGALPGYPASHGCVRLPNGFAERIFPLTKVGMRVVIARDDVAPVPFSDPRMPKPAPLPASATSIDTPVAIPMSYEDSGNDPQNGSPFMPDIHGWPTRQAQLDTLRAITAEKTADAQTAKDRAAELKRSVDVETAKRAKLVKAVKWAESARKEAESDLKQAEDALASARKPSAQRYWDKAKTRAETAKANADTRYTTAAEMLRQADEAIADANKDYLPALAAATAAEAAAKDAKRHTLPVSIFVSLKTKRLYVRQGYEPVFDVPVTIADPDKPIGTNVFTAVDFADEGKDVRWTVVSLDRHSSQVASARDRTMTDDPLSPPPTDAEKARAALERVTFPPEVMARLQRSVWPGSSLIISDEDQSRETGKSTDFIVLISGEPQGGIKRRPKPAPPVFRDSEMNDDYVMYRDPYGRIVRYPKKKSFFWW